MTDEHKIMTWADLAEWLAALTPQQRAMRVVIFDNEAGAFTSEIMAFLASEDDAGELIYSYSEPPSEIAEDQPILQIY